MQKILFFILTLYGCGSVEYSQLRPQEETARSFCEQYYPEGNISEELLLEFTPETNLGVSLRRRDSVKFQLTVKEGVVYNNIPDIHLDFSSEAALLVIKDKIKLSLLHVKLIDLKGGLLKEVHYLKEVQLVFKVADLELARLIDHARENSILQLESILEKGWEEHMVNVLALKERHWREWLEYSSGQERFLKGRREWEKEWQDTHKVLFSREEWFKKGSVQYKKMVEEYILFLHNFFKRKLIILTAKPSFQLRKCFYAFTQEKDPEADF